MATEPQAILVVDDEPDIVTTLVQLLQREGHRVTSASDGKQAIACLGKVAFDVVITDLFMPEVDGAQLMMVIRRVQPNAAIVAMSGGGVYMSPHEALAMARRLGAVAVLPKPFGRAELIACLSSLEKPAS